MRIRRIFVPPEILTQALSKIHYVATAVPIFGERKDRFPINDIEKHIYGGSLFNLRYRFNKNWVLEATTAVLKEHLSFTHLGKTGSVSRSGFDDVVINTYCNLLPGRSTQLILYMLAGFPTSRKISALEGHDRLVGTKLFSLGGGAEGSCTFFERKTDSLSGILQARFIHFFERVIPPLLPCDDRLHPGNITDLFAAIHYRHKRHHLETGYDATLYTNGRISMPNQITKAPFVLRNSFYGNYMYIIRQRGAVGLGASGQFVRNPFQSKGFNLWASGTIIF